MTSLPALITHGSGLSSTEPLSDEFRQFLREIKAAPMLSAQEEQALADDFRQRNDLDAAHKLVFSHMRLVVRIARDYLGYRLPLPDLVQEGSIGLMRAVKKFDPRRGARLSTYAGWWIRSSIHEFILQGWGMVKVATTQMRRKLFFKLRSFRGESAYLSHDEAQMLAEKFDTDADTILDMDSCLSGRDVSLNQSAVEGGLDALDMIPDQRIDQESNTLANEQTQLLSRLTQEGLAQLDERERRIIIERHLSEKTATLETLSHVFSISRERVRQLEKRAMSKLKTFFSQAPDGVDLVFTRPA